MSKNNTLGPLSIITTYLGLLLLLGGTITVTFFELGFWNPVLNLSIASLQAALVIAFFMRLRWSTPLDRVVAATGFFFVLIMVTFTLSDFLTRGME